MLRDSQEPPTASATTTETLDQALSRVWEHDWRHRRSGPTLRSQAETAIAHLAATVLERPGVAETDLPLVWASMVDTASVTPEHIRKTTAAWYSEGLSPATITKRLNCLSKLGVNVEGCRVKVPKQLKWHLSEENLERLRVWLDDQGERVFLNFVFWTCRTGLRIEESLKLRRMDFTGLDGDPDDMCVTVPGSKTTASQATLPLSREAAECAVALFWDASETPTALMMPFTYEELNEKWQACRIFLAVTSNPTATLKALRRSAARYLHVDCGMPLHMVQQYLRHESMNTTLEYLRLTGGYGTEEMRRYLK